MSNQDNGETHIKLLTETCQNVSAFIKTIIMENVSKDEKMNNYVIKINDLEHLCSNFKAQQEHINEQVKKLACLLNFTINQDEVASDVLSQWIESLSKNKVVCTKKRKLNSSYSPLKLSLKDKTELNKNTENQSKCVKFDNENKMSSQNEFKNVWKLEIKRDGNPSDLLQKSKQTKLAFKSPENLIKLDISTFNESKPKTSSLNSTYIFSPEICNFKSNDLSTTLSDANTNVTQIDDTKNISLSHFKKIIKPYKNILSIDKTNILKSNISNITHVQTNEHDSCDEDETICSPIDHELHDLVIPKEKIKSTNQVLLDSFDVIPGLNDKQKDLPNYKFKEDPVRKRNERKCLNGGNCEDCCKFYEVNNTNPINAMNHYSRHRSVKNQYYAPTPPGFWDPI